MLAIVLLLPVIMQSCSKDGNDAPVDPCAGTTLSVTPQLTSPASGCSPNGTVTVTAAGGTGLTYQLNQGAFQASNVFNNIAAGTHSFTVKSSAGCSASATLNVVAGQPGALFTAVKVIITNNCAVAGCHVGPTPTGNLNFSQDCVIESVAATIKSRAVDAAGTPSQMPLPPRAALSQNDRDAISAWVVSGGKIEN